MNIQNIHMQIINLYILKNNFINYELFQHRCITLIIFKIYFDKIYFKYLYILIQYIQNSQNVNQQ